MGGFSTRGGTNSSERRNSEELLNAFFLERTKINGIRHPQCLLQPSRKPFSFFLPAAFLEKKKKKVFGKECRHLRMTCAILRLVQHGVTVIFPETGANIDCVFPRHTTYRIFLRGGNCAVAIWKLWRRFWQSPYFCWISSRRQLQQGLFVFVFFWWRPPSCNSRMD